MGATQPTAETRPKASRRRPRSRVCHRRGCGRRYQPKRWNQRYCQEAQCQKLIRRWQAARRQAKRRRDENVQAEHAAAERARRERAKLSPQAAGDSEFATARGHAAKIFFRFPCAVGPAATNLHKPPLATRPSIAAASAARPSATSKTANASGRPGRSSSSERNTPWKTASPRLGRVKPRGKHRRATRLARRPCSQRPPCAGRHLSP